MNCAICQIRKPRRHCPGVHGDICSVCCGTEREQSIDCPLDCPYLREAHEHERLPDVDPATLPNRDIEITEKFVIDNEIPIAYLAVTLFNGAMQSPGATDWDIREALEALVKTYRTRHAGLYYETLPTNLFAAAIVKSVTARLAEIERQQIELGGASLIPDSTIFGALVFLQQMEYMQNNGRKRSRAFLDVLRNFYIPSLTEEEASAGAELVEPDEPRIIL